MNPLNHNHGKARQDIMYIMGFPRKGGMFRVYQDPRMTLTKLALLHVIGGIHLIRHLPLIHSPYLPRRSSYVGDVEASPNRAENMYGWRESEGAESDAAGERVKDAAVGTGEHSKGGGFGRGTSFMPRHHKSEVSATLVNRG